MKDENKDKLAFYIGLACAAIVTIFLSLQGKEYKGFGHNGAIGGAITVGVGIIAQIILAFFSNDKAVDKKESS